MTQILSQMNGDWREHIRSMLEESWALLLLLLAVVWWAARAVVVANWVDGLTAVHTIAFYSFVITVVLAKSPIRGLWAGLMLLVSGIGAIFIRVVTDVAEVGERLASWLESVRADENCANPAH